MSRPDPHVAVVGGGISGLSAAFYLSRRGIPCTLFEKNSPVGGLIHSHRVLGCTLEAGPDSFLAAKPSVAQLAHDLGAGDQLIPSNDVARRIFVVRNGSLVPMPSGMVMMVPSDLQAASESPLFGVDTRQRFTAELNLPPRERAGDFSIRELVQDHFGSELLAYVAEPLLAGVYGGDPGNLSAPEVLPRFVGYERQFGSLIRGSQQERRSAAGRPQASLFLSFRHGMDQLISLLWDRLTNKVQVCSQVVTALSREAEGWRVHHAGAGLEASHVILAIPAGAAAQLLETVDLELASHLAAIPYSSALLASLIFRRQDVAYPLDGFGFLVPQPERRTIAAASWINTKFPSRVADGLVAIRAFLVDPQASHHRETPDSSLLQAVREDLRTFMGVTAAPVYAALHRWPSSMPQYVVGHGECRARILGHLTEHPGLSLASNYLDGVGIPDCIRWGRAAAASFRAS